ncbi:beta strand repeat-containing protein [Alicyclobacillus mali (ex Roth et al. 2021)]|uniref:beta strand repeat-containing protein n=1 Tax=Alicyclobacillus mali (ex Roth et al. 2021) TaxID=1123961 RepID=UPI001A8E9A8C|nr:hypothetical protein [Alicyclobacillus mali (ex Roth et al. 2021)]
MATITIAAPAGQTVYYTVSASGPQQNLSTPSVALEFVAPGQNGISPYAANANAAYTASVGTAVPVIFTLAPVGSTPQANVQVTFTLSPTGQGGNVNAYFTNSSGANLGQSVTAYTNSAGQAEVWVNSAYAGQPVEVQAQAANGTTAKTYVEWLQNGVPAQIANWSPTSSQQSPSSATAGTNVTITGTVEDALGNPVPNATLLVTSVSGKGKYVSGSTATAFPNVVVGTGTPATSTYGDVITTNASGNFSVTVTDSTGGDNDQFVFYPVSGGYVSGAALGTEYIDFASSNSTFAGIAVAPFQTGLSSAASNGTTSVSGIQVQGGGQGSAYFEPYTPAGSAYANSSLTYNLSVNNGGSIASVIPLNSNGSVAGTLSLNSGVSAAQLTVTYSGSEYTFMVPGVQTSVQASSPAFEVVVSNSTAGNTVLTVSSGSSTATATFDFLAGAPSQLANVSPVVGSLNSGQSTTLTFTVEDSNGNPVGNTTVPVDVVGNSAPLWITQVNGTSLQQTINSTTEPTPIPLYAVPGWGSSNYSSVIIPGVVSAALSSSGNPATLDITTNSSGVATLTIQDGNVSYYESGQPGNLANSGTATQGTTIGLGFSNGAIQLGQVSNPVASISYPSNVQVGTVTVSPTTLTTSSTQSPYVYDATVTVKDVYGNPINGLTASNFAVVDKTNSITYTGVASSPQVDDFTVSGSNGTYSLAVYAPASESSSTLNITVTSGGVSQTQSVTY